MLLPQPELADDRQRLTRGKRKADAVDGFHRAVTQIEIGAQVLDGKQRHGRAVLHFRLFGGHRHALIAQPRIEDVAQRVAEQVGAEHRQADGDAREDHQPGRGAHVFGGRFRQHAAPGRMRLRHA